MGRGKTKAIIVSKFSIHLNSKTLRLILNLKSLHYKYNFKQQKKWFNKNINKKDLHNLVYYKKSLIGYNCLRNLRIMKVNNKKVGKVKLFDTLVFKPNYRGRGFSDILLKKNIAQLNKTKLIGLLYCKKNMLGYYKKYNWIRVRKNQVLFDEVSKKNLFPMLFNNKNFDIKKISIKVSKI